MWACLLFFLFDIFLPLSFPFGLRFVLLLGCISNLVAAVNGDLSSDRSESIPSLSPISPPNPEPPPPISDSSSDTSYSSPTATVAYDTAPSSPIKSPPSTSTTFPVSPPLPLPITPKQAIPSSVPPSRSSIIPKDQVSVSSSSNIAPNQKLAPVSLKPTNKVSTTTTTTTTTTATTNRPRPTPAPCPSESMVRSLDFSQSDQLRRRLGSIVRSSTAGLSSGVQLSLLETHPLCKSFYVETRRFFVFDKCVTEWCC